MPLYLVESPLNTNSRSHLRQRLANIQQRATRIIEALSTTSNDELFTIVEANDRAEVERFAGRLGLSTRRVSPVHLHGQSVDEVLYEASSAQINYLVQVGQQASPPPYDNKDGHAAQDEPLRFERSYRSEESGESLYLYDTPSAAHAIAAQEQHGSRLRRLTQVEKIA